MQALSGLMTAPGRFMQRVAITARSGEECVLTFTLEGMPTQPPAPPSAEAFTPFSDLQEPPALPGGTINSIPSMSPDVRLHPSGNDNGKTTNASSSSGSSGGPTTPAIAGTGTGSNSSAGAAGGRAAVAGSAYIWKLRCVRGEPALPLPDHPSAPSPEYPPEVLVAASLSALQ